MKRSKKTTSLWPLFSMASFMFITIVLGSWLFGVSAGGGFLTAFGVLSAFFAFFPKRVSVIEESLDKLPIETHIGMTVLGSFILLVGIIYHFSNYQLTWVRKDK
jgi:hypothetical protein